MGFPSFNTKNSFNSKTVYNSASIYNHFYLKKSAMFSFWRFLGFFHWAWDQVTGDKIVTMDVEPHLRQGLSVARLPTAVRQGRKWEDKRFYIQEKSHLSQSDKQVREQCSLFCQTAILSHLLCRYFQWPTGLCPAKPYSQIN